MDYVFCRDTLHHCPLRPSQLLWPCPRSPQRLRLRKCRKNAGCSKHLCSRAALLYFAGGLGTAHLSPLVRTFQNHMRSRKLSDGLLFLEFQQAFYSVFRLFLTGFPHTPDGFLYWCFCVGIQENHARAMLASLEAREDCATATMDPHLRAQLQDVLNNTWCQVRESDAPVSTDRGSRPGDPLADVLFALVLIPPLRRLNDFFAVRWPDTDHIHRRPSPPIRCR